MVNFGGPRHLDEIASFLTSLLQDRDVVRTRFPRLIHNWLFGRIARRRALKIREDYAEIGGRSPIYFDTENLAHALSQRLGAPVLTFHRYLPATHAEFLNAVQAIEAEEIRVLPLFPQFCYATTGSIARYFAQTLPPPIVRKLRWIKSYAAHPRFVSAYQTRIAQFLTEKQLAEKDTALLFSAHGIPQTFVDQGDLYESECILSYRKVMQAFPDVVGKLSYQSKFGPGEWLRPYTDETCRTAKEWVQNRKQIVIVPISFTSDHIETLFEIEKLYLPLLKEQGFDTYRCPALNLETYWLDALFEISQETLLCANQMLIRTANK